MKKFLLLLALLGCTPPSVTGAGVSPEASDPSAQVCKHLSDLGCPAARDQGSCTTVVRHVAGTHLTVFDTPCIMAAKTKEEVRHCGGLSCE